MDQTNELTRIDEVDRVSEQRLMKGIIESITKQQIGGKKQNVIAGNETVVPRNLGIQARNENANEGESLKTALVEEYKEIVGLRNKLRRMTNKG